MTRTRRAFTLIELLVVIAITAVLMTIIIVPVIKSFDLTRAAQAWSEAQNKARTLTERIVTEVDNAEGIRDNTGVHGELDIVMRAKPGSGSAVAGYDSSHEWIRIPIFNAKLDIIKVFQGDPTAFRNGAFINPHTGLADPTAHAPIGQPSLSAAPGLTLVRYFVGLRNPLRPADEGTGLAGYMEPYTGLLQEHSSLRDNLYVLYRAEVQPTIWSPTQNKFVVNKAFFYDQNRDSDPNTAGPLYDDPTFFDPTVAYPAYATPDPDGPDPSKAQMVQNWMNVAVIQTEVSRFDMVQPVFDTTSRQVVYDGNAPRMMTLVQFRPTRISSEPAEGQMSSRPGQESDYSSLFGPDVFTTRFRGWSNVVIRSYANTYDRTNTSFDKYMVGLRLKNPAVNEPQDLAEYIYDPDQGAFDDTQTGLLIGATRVGHEVFDVDMYKKSLTYGFRAPFSRGIAASNSRSGWLSSTPWHNLFEPCVPDLERGKLIASFGINEVGVVSSSAPFLAIPLPDPANNPNNLPSNVTWPDNSPPQSAVADFANVTAGVFSDAQYSSINKKYNKIWHDYPGLHGNIHRFIDLRVTPNDDGAASPLSPDPATGFARAQIVPGSEEIYAPDQNSGPNYGNIVRYTRTTHEPGPNQYRINYVNQTEPNYALLGLSSPPPVYTPADFTSAVFQPRYKAGYIQFNSDPNVPLPGDNPATGINEAKILIFYRFQFSQPNDVMAVDYDSRELMSIQMTIRNYPQSSLPNPQAVTLHSTASVRNFTR